MISETNVKPIPANKLMRPTLNSRGNFINRSVCGSPDELIKTTLQKQDPDTNFMK